MWVEMEDFCKKNFINSEHPTLRDCPDGSGWATISVG
jgi:hypothetical protein